MSQSTSAAVDAPLTGDRDEVRQYTRRGVLAVWAAAAVPMGLLAWVVVPAAAGADPGPRRFALTLVWALLAGLAWQFLLAMVLVGWEQRQLGWSALRWSRLRSALWLLPPSDRRGRRGGRLWWWALAGLAVVAALDQLPFGLTAPDDRSLGLFLQSDEGQATMRGNWGLFALVLVTFLFNSMLGEELLFRGVLLPRMRAAFGKLDWIANGVLFGLYHLHQPWSMPGSVATGLVYAGAARRWRSTWLSIIIHSGQSVFFTVLVFALVLS